MVMGSTPAFEGIAAREVLAALYDGGLMYGSTGGLMYGSMGADKCRTLRAVAAAPESDVQLPMAYHICIFENLFKLRYLSV